MHTLKILARIIAGLWASAGSTNPVVSQPGGDCDADPCLINDSPSENVDKIPERHRCSQGAACLLQAARETWFCVAANSPWVALTDRPLGTVLESQQGDWTGLEE